MPRLEVATTARSSWASNRRSIAARSSGGVAEEYAEVDEGELFREGDEARDGEDPEPDPDRRLDRGRDVPRHGGEADERDHLPTPLAHQLREAGVGHVLVLELCRPRTEEVFERCGARQLAGL